MESYLPSVVKQFRYYKMLGEKTFAQLEDEQLFFQQDEFNNSIAVIVKHLWGNMLSRWTNFLETDGEKEWRQREEEFDNDILSREEMINKWEEGWECLFQTLNSLRAEDLEKKVYIRNQAHTIVEAISRQLAHYAYHIGQIVFQGKLMKKENWQSLSIPKGESKNFNKAKFSGPARDAHYTDEFLKDK